MRKIKLSGNDKESLDDFLRNNELLVWSLILEAVEYGIEYNIDEVQVLETDPVVERLFVFSDGYKTTLERAINIFESYEKYEECGVCQKLISDLLV